MDPTGNQRPFISIGSFFLGTAILAAGMIATLIKADAGMTGWSMYWPIVVAAPVAAIVNVVAFGSPGGSIFELAKELIKERRGSR